MTVQFTSGAYYVPQNMSTAVVTLIRGRAVPAKPLKLRLLLLEINSTLFGRPGNEERLRYFILLFIFIF